MGEKVDNAEHHAKTVEDKLINLKEKSRDRRGVTGPAEVLEEMVASENENSNQTQDHRDSL